MALDGLKEVEEINELYPSDKDSSQAEAMPDLPEGPEYEGGPTDGFHVEALQSAEDVELMLGVESGKAEAVMGLAESTLASAITTTGDASMFADETAELASMAVELQALGSEATSFDFSDTFEWPDTDSTSMSIELKPSVVDGPGVLETNSGVREDIVVAEGLGELPSYETIESILPETEKSSEKPVKVLGTEFSNLNENEKFTVERAGDIAYYKSEKAKNPAELHNIVVDLQELNKKEFSDDAKYEEALSVMKREMDHLQVGMPFVVEGGAVDLDTGKKSDIEIITPNEPAPKSERPTKEQLDEAHKAMMGTTRGRLMDMIAYMQDYEAVATGKLEGFQKGMPESRMRELKRKSWFSKTENETNVEPIDEIEDVVTTSEIDSIAEADAIKEEANDELYESTEDFKDVALEYSWVDRYPTGEMEEVTINAIETYPSTEELNFALKNSNLTSGRRGNLASVLDEGIDIFSTTINEGITEEPSVFCGKIKDSLFASESIRSNYGNIFSDESEGYVLMLEIPEDDENYKDHNIEVQLTRPVKPKEIRGIIVGNDAMYANALRYIKDRNLNMVVIKASRTQKSFS